MNNGPLTIASKVRPILILLRGSGIKAFLFVLSDLRLYEYHKQKYDGLAKEMFVVARFIEDKQWEIVGLLKVKEEPLWRVRAVISTRCSRLFVSVGDRFRAASSTMASFGHRRMRQPAASRMLSQRLVPDRGYLREGYVADIVIIDPDRYRDRATFENPRQLSEGVVHAIVNGTFAIRDEEATGALAGQALRRTSWSTD